MKYSFLRKKIKHSIKLTLKTKGSQSNQQTFWDITKGWRSEQPEKKRGGEKTHTKKPKTKQQPKNSHKTKQKTPTPYKNKPLQTDPQIQH